MGLFYTGKGDHGRSFVGKKSVDKTCLEIQALGDLDELNSLLGLVKCKAKDKKNKEQLETIQEDLFIIQATVASSILKTKFRPPEFSLEKVLKVEKVIDDLEKKVSPAKKFIIPGTSIMASWLDYARAVSRRVERQVLFVSKRHQIPQPILSYLNRLSSLFFAMARYETKRHKIKERHPTYK